MKTGVMVAVIARRAAAGSIACPLNSAMLAARGGELRRAPTPPGCGSSLWWLRLSVTLALVSVLRGLVRASSGQRSPARRVLAWVLMIVGPAVITVALLPFRSSVGLGGFLFCTLLVLIAVAVIGGAWPALAGVVLGVLAGAFFFAPPYENLSVDVRPDLVSLVGFVIVGLATGILIGKLAQLAEEQASSGQVEAALRRVATLVARAAQADELFGVVTEEAGRLLDADFAALGRYERDDEVTLVAAWSRAADSFPVGRSWTLEGENISGSVLRTGRPVRVDDFADLAGPLAADARARGTRSEVGAPIIVEGRIWGVMVAGLVLDRLLPPDAEARLASVTGLLATAIANAESRAEITRLAEEQAALRRVATLVARGAPADELFGMVTEVAGQLLAADMTTLSRYESDGTVTVVAGWSRIGDAVPVGVRPRLGGTNLTTLVWQTRRPARMDSYADASSAIAAVIGGTRWRSGVGAPVIVQDRLWGVMSAGSFDEQPLGPGTEARLASFTELVATAIANTESRSDLDASRARIVAASDQARRRIERDLHDGAQQRLVTLGLALAAARTAAPPQLGELDSELADIAQGLASVLDELREMARGIHPAILAKGGLIPALKTLAHRCPVPVELDVRAAARLPERVEVAAYYVVSEALTNAAKHAHASVVSVEVEAVAGTVRLHVRDDGAGGADPVRGSGLVGLKDRVEALGGTLIVQSPAGSGTALHVELPLDG
jgi:signal transduction histidine kinase